MHANINMCSLLQYVIILTQLSTYYTNSTYYSPAVLQAVANGMNIDKRKCYCTSHDYGNMRIRAGI